jgi:hypothetical protein
VKALSDGVPALPAGTAFKGTGKGLEPELCEVDRVNVRLVAMIALVASGCSGETLLAPGDLAGTWPLQQIDGHPLGWYHWTNVECQAAPTEGELEIEADRSWRFEMAYDFRCVGATSYDGSSSLLVSGDDARGTERLVILLGRGPDLVGNVPDLVPWTLEVTPMGELMQVRFSGDARYVWADPVFTMGPRAMVP